MAKQKVVATESAMVQLDPSVVMADDNTRYGLKDTRIESLAASILAQGGVMVPVEVEPYSGPAANGYTYRLTTGFYRHAAVKKLNEQGAGLTLPAIVHSTGTPVERLKRQIAENVERESLSIMDTAAAIDKLLNAGVPRVEIREMFAGRRGKKSQPASNAWLNMTHSFLTLPKSMQTKIDNGTLTTSGAYELIKAPKEKWDAIVAKAEQSVKDATERDEKEEKRFLAQQAKSEAAEKEKQEALETVAKAEEEMNKTREIANNRQKLAIDAYAKTTEGDAKTRKAANETYKAADADYKAAKAIAEKAEKDYQSKKEKHDKVSALAADHADKLRKARAASATTKKDAVSGKDVKAAAKAAGEATTPIPLTAKECRDAVHDLTLPGGPAGVIAIGLSLEKCFLGIITPETMYKEMVKILKG